jgi:hypothetical protein
MPSIAQTVRAAISTGVPDSAILALLRERHPTCADPAHTVSYYRSEARNGGPRQRGATTRRAQTTGAGVNVTLPTPETQLAPALSWSGEDGQFDASMLDQARRFGLEFEFCGPSGTDRSGRAWADVVREALAPWPEQRIGDSHGYYHSDGTTWDVKSDASCEWELATPALSAADWPKVEAVLAALVRQGARVDARCGFHVHHEARGAGHSGRGFLGRLIRLWGALDVPLHEALPSSRRQNRYAERWGRVYADELAGVSELSREIRQAGRFQALNLTHWWRRGVVEVRSHHGTLDAQKAGWWLAITQQIVGFAQLASDAQMDALLERGRTEQVFDPYLHGSRTRPAGFTTWGVPKLWALLRLVVGDAAQRTLARWTADRNPEHYRLAFAA